MKKVKSTLGYGWALDNSIIIKDVKQAAYIFFNNIARSCATVDGLDGVGVGELYMSLPSGNEIFLWDIYPIHKPDDEIAKLEELLESPPIIVDHD